MGVILAVGASLILTYGGVVLLHRRQLTPGELMIFMTYLGMIYDPLCQITGFRFNLESGLAGARRVSEVFDRDALVTDAADATFLPLQPRSLILEAVGFEYSSDQKILQRIDVNIEPGQSVAFVGSSGAGSFVTSAALKITCTPGSATAALASTLRTRACGIGERSSLQNTMPSARKSSAYLALPVTLPCTSAGTKFFPNKS